jgi:DivIVA domain-containing protein
VDREAIERRDFPVGRRGYDPDAVDAHLRRVADEFEAVRGRGGRAGLPPASPLAAGASEQVRHILEAAEAGAAELRADAGRQASGHVARVKDAADGMLSRLDDLERELGTLLEALRQSGERLNEGLARLQQEAGDLGGAGAPDDEVVAPSDDLTEPSGNGGPASDDEAGARLIALNMALSGTPREETARYLAEHFTLADPEALLDDVYDRADQ